ncbi:MAG: glyoxalase [Candidatus Poribacteria bacterium]|nr:MAG: glyoxalase [Candidatus Poribacteria bacterium]
MGLRVEGIHHVSILVTDFDRSREFYGGILGLEEIAKPSTFNFEVVWFRFGEDQLHLIPSPTPDVPSPRHFALHVEDAQAAREHLKKHGCVVEETTPIPGADRFFTFDPDGNRIELIQWFEDYGTGR